MISILFAGAVSMVLTLIGTRWAITLLAKRGYGQEIRDDGPTSHHTKRGTPTMGGTVFIIATIVGYFAAKLFTMTPPSASALLVLFLFAGMGAVGFLDDFIKIFRQRSLGLRSKAKLAGQTHGRGGVRGARAAVPGRARAAAGVAVHLVHPRHRLAASCR